MNAIIASIVLMKLRNLIQGIKYYIGNLED